jgi:hypothetical protein
MYGHRGCPPINRDTDSYFDGVPGHGRGQARKYRAWDAPGGGLDTIIAAFKDPNIVSATVKIDLDFLGKILDTCTNRWVQQSQWKVACEVILWAKDFRE